MILFIPVAYYTSNSSKKENKQNEPITVNLSEGMFQDSSQETAGNENIGEKNNKSGNNEGVKNIDDTKNIGNSEKIEVSKNGEISNLHSESNSKKINNLNNQKEMKKAKNTTVCLFSISRDVEEGACLNGADLVIKRRGKVLKVAGIDELQLTGNQNYQNVLAAAFLAYEGGIPLEAIHDGIIEFKGLPHRIEFVRELDGVSYYNDSKATNTDAAIKGMETFDRPIILIAGGYDKHTKLDKFMKTVKARVKCLILLGNAAARFKDEAEKAGIKTIVLADDMRGAVEKGKSIACSGDVVLLSPACSSFDMYANYEARGFDFKKIVNRLK